MSTTLSQGDIAVIQYSSSVNGSVFGDGFTFVLLTAVDATTSINFTDSGFNSSGAITVAETTWTWTSGAALAAGTVVRIHDAVNGDSNDNIQTASTGGLTFTGDNSGFQSSGDQVFAYQGAVAGLGNSPSLLFGLSLSDVVSNGNGNGDANGDGWNDNSSADGNESQLPSSLTGFEVGFPTEPNNAYFNPAAPGAVLSGTKAAILASILDNANWTTSDAFQGDPPASYTFLVGGAAPSVDLDGPGGDADFEATFTENVSGAVNIADSDATLTDADSASLDVLTVTITNFQSGDVLAATASGGILAGDISYNGAGVLTINPAALQSLADFQAVLRSITYNSTSDTPNTTARTITVVANDGTSGSAAATSTITVVSTNDAPAIAGDLSATVAEGGTVFITTTDLTENDPDDSGTGLTYTVTATDNGHVELTTNAGVAITSFTQDDLANNRVVFRHDGSETTTGSFSVSLADGGENGVSPATATVNLTVNGVDDPSVAQDDAVTVTESGTLLGDVHVNNGSGADSDPEGNNFDVTEVNGSMANVGGQFTLPSGALLTVLASGTFLYDPNGAFDHLPGPASGAQNLTGTDSFTYAITGGDTATVTVTVSGLDSDDTVIGSDTGPDVLAGGIGNDRMRGLSGDDTLQGGIGNDILNGGAGGDAMTGGNGNDFYFVDALGDTVSENANEGLDKVFAQVSQTLGDHVEDLRLSGLDDIDGTGNGQANRIIGNDGANTLTGLAGDDRLAGGAGADVLIGGAGRDRLDGGAGADIYRFSALSDSDSVATRDILRGFVAGTDDIDVTGLGFTSLVAGAFTGVAGQLRFVSGANTLVYGDIDGDRVADFQFQLTGIVPLTADDFIGL